MAWVRACARVTARSGDGEQGVGSTHHGNRRVLGSELGVVVEGPGDGRRGADQELAATAGGLMRDKEVPHRASGTAGRGSRGAGGVTGWKGDAGGPCSSRCIDDGGSWLMGQESVRHLPQPSECGWDSYRCGATNHQATVPSAITSIDALGEAGEALAAPKAPACALNSVSSRPQLHQPARTQRCCWRMPCRSPPCLRAQQGAGQLMVLQDETQVGHQPGEGVPGNGRCSGARVSARASLT